MSTLELVPHTSAATPDQMTDRVVIVVDTLRATSTIAALLTHGARAVYPVTTIDEAFALREALGPEVLLCGERGGLAPAGFDAGNSPVEIAGIEIVGRVAVLTTTNGTLALRKAWEHRGGGTVITAAVVNLGAALTAAVRDGREVTVLCAGKRNGTAAVDEDTYTGGLLATSAAAAGYALSRQAAAARRMAVAAGPPDVAIPHFKHAGELVALGLEADVEWCSRLDSVPVVPVLRTDARGRPCIAAG